MHSPDEADEDAIDLQDLQAQIDLSMSFAQNLVTSWVKTADFAQAKRKRDLENELKEYMRRPARLGVGAPIPETQSLAREAARLKSKLETNKRRHKEPEAHIKPASEDEEESRAGAIKKARLNPFDVTSKAKKKKSDNALNGVTSPPIHPAAMKALSQKHATTEPQKGPEEQQPSNDRSLSNISKKKNKDRTEKPNDVTESPPTLPTRFQAQPLSSNTRLSDHPVLPLSSDVRAARESPTSLERPAIACGATPLSSPHHMQNSSFLRIPLLNLEVSPAEGESDGQDGKKDVPSSPKRKRKRKKKKKTMQELANITSLSKSV